MVDSVIDAVRESGVECAALVRIHVVRPSVSADVGLDESIAITDRSRDATQRLVPCRRIRADSARQIHRLQPEPQRVPKISTQGPQVDKGECFALLADSS